MACSIKRELIEKTIAFHGHLCPGLAIGIRAAELALQKMGHAGETDLVAIVETDMCGVDAIQFLTGCTFGKGNLIHKDYGKRAFSFYDRRRSTGFRAVLRPDISDSDASERQMLAKKVEEETANEEEHARYDGLRRKQQERVMNGELEEIFSVTAPVWPVPKSARILSSLRCESCGEMTMESRTRRFGGKTLCIPCFEKVEQKR
ncbi:MAG: formylmethanofuran dehydrogenase [Deltaproteobacteria bacterium RBG_13_52_11b]|nr:MAG: formylmethanofuran dehydrogenase [Deltaproteobacteria bacterium RBG_13_52_11b]